MTDQPYEEVLHPQHYQLAPGVEVIDLVETLNFNLGSAVKYACRAGKKPGTDAVTDLRKAIWYLQREIDRLNAAPAGSSAGTTGAGDEAALPAGARTGARDG